MPCHLTARAPQDATEERQVRRLAGSRHAPGDWIRRAQMVSRSWDGHRVAAIAIQLGCHPQTVRERLQRFNAEGLEGLGDRPGPGRKPRLTEAQRGVVIRLARSTPPGQPTRWRDGTLVPDDEAPSAPAHWTLDRLVEVARAEGVTVARSQIRRILLKEGVRWRGVRSWATSTDPDFVPKGRRSSSSTRTHRQRQR